MLKLMLLLILSLAPLITQSVRAEETKPKKTTTIDFQDELIEGEVQKPELIYLLQKRQFNFKRLIRLRENFIPELKRDSEQLPRGRSGQ